ncbi:Pre-mRNA cleavage complex II protein Clp1-domain-containing protein [Phycomyces nitens]|nr:Pre-mRNA cleavage complex II protein Clp1-domain-containing protein [Phycomyces nitens]
MHEEEEIVDDEEDEEDEDEEDSGEELLSVGHEDSEMAEDDDDEDEIHYAPSETGEDIGMSDNQAMLSDGSGIERSRAIQKKAKPSAKKPRNLTFDENALSKFLPVDTNVVAFDYEKEHYLCIGLQKGETLVFAGQVLVAPVFGAISVMGSVLSSVNPVVPAVIPSTLTLSFHPVFSPKTHSLLMITPSVKQAKPRRSDFETTIDQLDDHLGPMVSRLAHFEAVFIMKDVTTGLEELDDLYPAYKGLFEFPRNTRKDEPILPINSLKGFHPILNATTGVRALKTPISWDTEIDQLIHRSSLDHKPIISLVCGSKNLGKSSLSRHLVNRLLNSYKQVAFIEADVGQTEFTPPGMVSLHILSSPILGPPFTHQNIRPVRSFFIGSASAQKDPSYYLECLEELMSTWQFECTNTVDDDFEPIPLVFNTHGWIKGLGYDLLLSIIKKVQPTDVFAFYSRQNSNAHNLPPTFANSVSMICDAGAPVMRHVQGTTMNGTLSDRYDASSLRALSMISYFHKSPSSKISPHQPIWNFGKRLVECVPWTLDWRHLKGVWVLFEEVATRQLLYSLNGSVVGLIGDVVDYKPVESQSSPTATQEQSLVPPAYFDCLNYPPPPPTKTTCHGLAIIRAIDPSKHAFLLLTPLPLETLKLVSGIVKGDLELPMQCMLDEKMASGPGICGVPWNMTPYVTTEAKEGAGGDSLRVRRNLMRRAQM